MKPVFLATLAAAAAMLAGCSGKGEGEADKTGAGAPASVAEAARQAGKAGLKPQPGLYRTTITMTGIEIPGLGPEMEGHGAGLARTLESCLTKAEVDKGFEALLTRGQDGTCRFESFALKEGALDAVMLCEAQGASTRTEMEGTLAATRAEVTASTRLGFGGGVEGTMNVATRHERIGDCPAG